ncbi:MAG: InlB B-repeat-containing protein [Chitinispirillales bacterium]|jgi:uncharacterized protein (TIGR02145 family)/uncharacterized repeat protein (TIGR02543 family)|nr:InlB B-repeat-containing protein [Chitinispirillales bacterium]
MKKQFTIALILTAIASLAFALLTCNDLTDEHGMTGKIRDRYSAMQKYTIAFNTNGGLPENIPSIIVDSGTVFVTITPDDPTKFGHDFDGWSDGWTMYEAATIITRDATLIARWTETPIYTISYDANGGEGIVPVDDSSPYFRDSEVAVLSGENLTREEHRFDGWNTRADGSGITYQAGNTFNITDNTTLFARWIYDHIPTFSVAIFKCDGTIDEFGSGNYEAGTTIEINAGEPSVGEQFKSWRVESGGVTLANANNPTTTFIISTNPVEVRAVCGPIPEYTVTYNGNGHTGGDVPIDNNSPYLSGLAVTVLGEGNLSKEGYYFTGWNTRVDGSGNAYIEGNTFVITDDITLYAQWDNEPTYLVTLVSNPTGASVSGSGNYRADIIVTINAGTLENHRFTGWTVVSGGVHLDNADNAITTFTTPANPVTIMAHFVPVYTVTVSSAGTGTAGSSSSGTATQRSNYYSAGTTISITAGTPPTGQQFRNWTVESGGVTLANINNATTTFTMPTNSVTLRANFEARVTYNANGGDGGNVPVDNNSPYLIGSTVTVLERGSLTRAGHAFNGWNTAANESGTPYSAGNTFEITGDITLFAQWIRTYTLTTTVTPSTIPSNPSNITTGGTVLRIPNSSPGLPAGVYVDGTVVSVVASANSAFAFDRWSGVATSTNSNISVTMSSNRTLTANFQQVGTIRGPEFTDTRDNRSYPTVIIGNQVWMAANLNYETLGSWCYDNNSNNCGGYGRHYNWATAMGLPPSCNTSSCAAQTPHRGICPEGWHIPSDAEWTMLVNFVSTNNAGANAGTRLKTTTPRWNGEDIFGFSALPGGTRWPGGINLVGGHGYWYSATENDATSAWYRHMGSNINNVSSGRNKADGFSLRCIRN